MPELGDDGKLNVTLLDLYEELQELKTMIQQAVTWRQLGIGLTGAGVLSGLVFGLLRLL